MINKIVILIAGLILNSYSCYAEIIVAVTSNFYQPLVEITNLYTKNSGVKITIVTGSTGKLYTQIVQGAEFDMFLSSDQKRPLLLENKSYSSNGNRFTYAVGKLVFWAPDNKIYKDSLDLLLKDNNNYIVMANPRLAPYGEAAQSVLNKLNLLEKYNEKIITAENVNQAYMYIDKKQVNKGFISLSQIYKKSAQETKNTNKYWLVPQSYYNPILQQAVLLKKSEHNKEALDFFQYLKNDQAIQIIKDFGYSMPKQA